jgi:hypothetical protein
MLARHISYKCARPAERWRKSCIAYSLFADEEGCGPRLHRDRSDKCTIVCICRIAASRCACSAYTQVEELLTPPEPRQRLECHLQYPLEHKLAQYRYSSGKSFYLRLRQDQETWDFPREARRRLSERMALMAHQKGAGLWGDESHLDC